MKVLMHDGNILTLPFTLGERPLASFDRLDAEEPDDYDPITTGTAVSIDEAELPGLINSGAARENAIATPTELMRDLRFIHHSLIDVSDGAEVGIESTGSGYRLLIADQTRAARDPSAEGPRCAFNPEIRPKALLNVRCVVESINAGRATVRLDEGDRKRVARLTQKAIPTRMTVEIMTLDKVGDS